MEITYRPPLYMWIIDRREAIFEISSFCPSFFCEAFWTIDLRLINALINMKNEYCSNVVVNDCLANIDKQL